MKLFGKGGKLNVVDYVILLALIAALVFVALWFFKSQDASLGSGAEREPSNVRFELLCEDLPADLCDNVVSVLNREAVEITGNSVAQTRLFSSSLALDADVVATDVTVNEDGTANIRFTVEAAAELVGGVPTLGVQEVRLGTDFTLKTLSIELECTVVATEMLQ